MDTKSKPAAHTPGPWETYRFDESQTMIRPVNLTGSGNPLICIVSIGEGRANGHENARLIAAAPELLAFVRAYLNAETPADHAALDNEAGRLCRAIESAKSTTKGA